MSRPPYDTREKLQKYIDDFLRNNPPHKHPSMTLTSMGITTLEGVKFPESITYLYLADNPIASLTNVTFPSELITLYMHLNEITTLKDVRFLPTMKTIKISNNKLTTLDGVVFPPKLTDLDLRYNQITSLDGVMFPPGLVSLDLSNNKITSFAGMQFPLSLLNLKLEGNPIDVRTVSELKNPSPFVIREIVAAFPETGTHFQRMEEQKEKIVDRLLEMVHDLYKRKGGGKNKTVRRKRT